MEGTKILCLNCKNIMEIPIGTNQDSLGDCPICGECAWSEL